MAMSAGIAAAGSIVGGYLSSQGAKSAAQTQAQAALQAQQMQQQMLQQQLAAAQPWQQAGQTALGQLQAGLAPGGQFAQPFTLAQAQLSPAQQAVQQQSLEAMRNQMQLGGQNLSTNAITGAGQLAGNIAGQYEQQAFNQWLQQQQQQMGGLQNLAGMGLQGTGLATGAMGTAGQNIAGLQVGMGNVLGAGQAAQANAMAQGIGGAMTGVGQMYMLNSLLNPTPTGTPGASAAQLFSGAGSTATDYGTSLATALGK